MTKRTLQKLTYSIKKVLAVGMFTSTSLAAWANSQTQVQDIWLDYGQLQNICVHDFDQDGDLDIFEVYTHVMTRLENSGTPEFPEFSTQVEVLNYPNIDKLKRLGLTNCTANTRSKKAFVDIDGDGDLDLFSKDEGKHADIYFKWYKNEGTTEQPIYSEQLAKELGLPTIVERVLFTDIEGDGDLDFFGHSLYENIGTPENAHFVEKEPSPLELFCYSQSSGGSGERLGQGLIIDLNNDGQLDRLCDNNKGQLEYVESTATGYLPSQDLNNKQNFGQVIGLQSLDIDGDGDFDVLSHTAEYTMLYTNTSATETPLFDQGHVFTHLPEESDIVSFVDIDGDNDVDYFFKQVESNKLGLAFNTGSNLKPQYRIDKAPSMLEPCYQSLSIDGTQQVEYTIYSIASTDIDNDGDLDLFLYGGTYTPRKIRRKIVYCENKSVLGQPIFAESFVFDFNHDYMHPLRQAGNSMFFYDKDGDGDQDLSLQSLIFENIGTPTMSQFHLSSEAPSFSQEMVRSASIDTTDNGVLDSLVVSDKEGLGGVDFLYQGIEPADDLVVLEAGDLDVMTKTKSFVKVFRCDRRYEACNNASTFSENAQEMSISLISGGGERVAATVDMDGYINAKILDNQYKLIRQEKGIKGHSISVSGILLDHEKQGDESEFALVFVDENNQVTAAVLNRNGSVNHVVQLGEGKQPSVDTGYLSTNKGYAMVAYITLDNQLKMVSFLSDGTILGRGEGGPAIEAKIKGANLLPLSRSEEYVVVSTQPDGTVSLLGFTHQSELLGRVVVGAGQKPEVASANIFVNKDHSFVVSLIQEDDKPAIIFLDKLGRHVGKGVGETEAVKVAVVSNVGEAMLVYLDKEGIIRRERFRPDGSKMQ